ncbi:MAG: preprotein translocase subunit SecE [Calditrichaeota bacterium]|nr:MAG: preprotein translocase subunit SecE [Calditrichota bacterium]
MKLIEKPAKFITEVNQEMSKVSWPTYEELKDSTVIVIVLSLLLVAFIFASDWILTHILKLIF